MTTDFEFYGGAYTPQVVLEMVRKKEIDARDHLLLCTIFCLAAETGECYASNKYLAETVGDSISTLKERVKRLKEVGLLKQVHFDGRTRYLRPTYLFTEKEREMELNRQPKFRLSDSRKSGCIIKKKNNNSLPLCEMAEREQIPKKKSGLSKEKKWGQMNKTERAPFLNLAEQLKDAIGKSRTVSSLSNTSNWAEYLFRLHDTDEIPIQQIENIMDWYCGQWERGDLIRDNANYLPVATSGEGFRKKFTAIETAKLRMEKKGNAYPYRGIKETEYKKRKRS